ncbi:MAG TPA: ThuA domain-containing protein [Gemmatimonadales bacterium]|nr:ThuA domain-containing protein [Gemmatimonadales bacterium]
MSTRRRALLWSVPVAVLGAAALVSLKSWWERRPAETCPGHQRAGYDSLTVAPVEFRVLVLTAHRGYAHRSIPAATLALQDLGARNGFSVKVTADPAFLTIIRLSDFAVVVLLQTTGDFLDSTQQVALQHHVRAGRGVVAIHAALDAEPDWAWYHQLLGAEFAGHPRIQSARLVPGPWERTDEWYNYRAQPSADRVLLSVDERSYQGGHMGETHPVTWTRTFDGGRIWYTAMGHTTCSYSEPAFLAHVLEGIRWAARVGETRAGD